MDKIDNVKKEYEKVKVLVTAKDYIDDFKKTFNIVQDETVNINLLKELYYEFLIYNFKQSDSERFIVGKLADIEETLTKTFNDAQKEQLKIYNYLQYEMANNDAFNSFLWGFSLANELNMSSNSYATNNKILNNIILKYKSGNNKGGESNE